MRELSHGSLGMTVRLAQRMLNRRMGGASAVDESGEFSERTRRVLAEFQRRERITTERDRIGSRTWSALGLRIETEHALALISQTDEDGSWAAAAAMTMQRPSALGLEDIVPPPGFDLGGVRTLGTLESLATRYFWAAYPAPQTAGELIFRAGGKPVWLAGTLDSGISHAVAVAGATGDGGSDTTYFRMLDPRPFGIGSTHYAFYARSFPLTDGIFTPLALVVP